ncbi:MAG: hypothetical protein HW406_1326 [Candidatus Brocadiaceae bacterium]|nr:hypothetical protein [Candidatus Brocadiaceae bacterium]
MGKTINYLYKSEQKLFPPHLFIAAKRSSVLSSIYNKINNRFSVFKDFTECHFFYEGEITNTSGFETKILQINKITNSM